MRKVTIHNVVGVGMSLYFLSISLGVCFAIAASIESKVSSQNIIYLLSADTDSADANEDSKANKRFGSRLLGEEDDDDSTKDFISHFIIDFRLNDFSLFELTSIYSSRNRDINTPPPQG